MAIKFLNSLNADSGVLYVDADNNRVGIGTTNPNDILVVSNGSGEVRFGGGNGRTLSAYANGNLSNFDFYANQTYFNSDFLIAPGKKISTSNGSTDNLYLTTTNAAKAIYTDRSIGIGTTSPAEKLDVEGNARAVNLIAESYAYAGTGFQHWGDGGTGMNFPSNDNVDILTAGTTRMRVDPSGIITINSNSEQGWSGNKLNVGSTSDGANGINILTSTTGNGYIIFSDASDNSSAEYANQIRYSHTDNFLAIQTVGNERLRITSNGNVGIGATAPDHALHVKSSATGNATNLKIESTSQYGGLALFENTASRGTLAFGNDGNIFTGALSDSLSLRAEEALHLGAGGNNLSMTIATSGNVGIGTASPANKLHVHGQGASIYSVFARSDAKWMYLHSGANDPAIGWDAGGDMRFGTATSNVGGGFTERVRITSAGNVGIGTASPSYKLDVDGQIVSRNSTAGRLSTISGTRNINLQSFSGDWNYLRSNGANFFIGTEDASNLYFATNNSQRMTIAPSGNVGIGTTNPTSQFHIHASFNATSGDLITTKIYSNGNVAANGNTRTGLDVETNRTGWYNSDSTSGNFKISNNNRIGVSNLIGVKSLATIDVNNIYSGVSAQGSLTAFYGKVTTTYTTGSGPVSNGYGLRIDAPEVAANSKIVNYYGAYIDGGSVLGTLTNKYALVTEANAGNVGIGTTSPSYKLEVQGDFYTNGTNGAFTTANSQSNLYLLNLTRTSTSLITAGRVGIGTNTPSQMLHVVGSVNIEDDLSFGIGGFLGTSTSIFTMYSLGDIVYNSDSNNNGSSSHIFQESGNELMRITSSGNVGIGTTAPNGVLDVLSRDDQRYVRFRAPNGEERFQFYVGSTGNSSILTLYQSDGSTQGARVSSEGGSWFNGGNVGIGTASPGAKLDVNGNISINAGQKIQLSGSNDSTHHIYHDSSTDYDKVNYSTGFQLEHHTAGVQFAVVGGTGNVGIGTTGPAAKLTVAGTAYINQTSDYFGVSNTKVQISAGSSSNNVGIRSDKLYLYSYGNGTDSQLIFGDGNAHWALFASDNRFALYNHATSSTSMHVSSAGNVGIGTNSPQRELHVKGDSWAELRLEGRTLASGHGGAVEFYSEGTALADINALTTKDLVFRTNGGTERIRILANGNVGIGTTSPSSKLHIVDGNNYVKIGDLNGVSTAVIELNDSAPVQIEGYSSDLTFRTNGSRRMTITNGGNVGIGTTSPGSKLVSQISAPGYSIVGQHSSGGQVGFYNSTADNGVGTVNNYSLNLFTNNSAPQVTLTTGGNVGIGTTAPEGELHVAANSGTSVKGIMVRSGDLSGQSNPILLWLEAAGEVGIRYKETGNGEYFQNTYDGTRINWKYFNGSIYASRMVLTNSGNVGIGTASPSEKLHVVGDVRIEGDLTVNGSYTQIDTDVNTTEQWNVTNDGTGPAVTINQTGAQDIMDVQDDGTSVFYIEDGGNVGIGTTDPASKLDINIPLGGSNGITLNTNDEVYSIWSNSNLGGLAINADSVGSTSRYDLFIRSNTGNVGIGTISPSEKLHVNGNIKANGSIGVTNIVTNRIVKFNGSVLDDSLLYDNGTSIGLGTNSPNAWAQLETSGTVAVGGILYVKSSQKIQGLTGFPGSAGNLSINPDGGNVGIGTTSPSEKLEVDGNVKADSFIGGNEAGIYTFNDTVNASASEDIFRISNNHGAQAFRVTFVCSTSSYSVAKTYEVVHSYGNDPVFFKVVDTGAFGGHDFDVSFTDDLSNTGTKCTITNNSTTVNADIATTVFLGGSPTTITVTAL